MHPMLDIICDVLMSEGCGDSNQCEATARAVVKAMMHPTDDVLDAGSAATNTTYDRTNSGRAWQAMLRKILDGAR